MSADNASLINATVSNAASSVASALWGAKGKSVGAIVASNKVSSLAQATITSSTVTHGGAVSVTAADAAGVFANVKMVSSSSTTNDGGASVLQHEISNFVPADFLSTEGTQTLKYGDRVRVKAGHTAGGTVGGVYRYLGEEAAIDLGNEDYTDLGYWQPVEETTLIPQGLNVSTSDSTAVGGIVVLNDVRSTVDAHLASVTLTAGSLSLSADETAIIVATADSSATSSGGSSFNGKGASLAVNATIATNAVQSSTKAYIDASDVTTTRRHHARRKQHARASRRPRSARRCRAPSRSASCSRSTRSASRRRTSSSTRSTRSSGSRRPSSTTRRRTRPASLDSGDRVKLASGDIYSYLGPTLASPDLSPLTQNYADKSLWNKVTQLFGAEKPASAEAYITDSTVHARTAT